MQNLKMSADEEFLKAIPCTERYQPRNERYSCHVAIRVSSDALQSGFEKSVSTDDLKDTCAMGLHFHPSTDHFNPVLIAGRSQCIQLRPEELNPTKDTSYVEDRSTTEISDLVKTANQDTAKPPLCSKDQAGSFNPDSFSAGAQVDRTGKDDAFAISSQGLVEKNASTSAGIKTVANELLMSSHHQILSAEDTVCVTGRAEDEFVGPEADGQTENKLVEERATCQAESSLVTEKIDEANENNEAKLAGEITIDQDEKLKGEKMSDHFEKLEGKKQIIQAEKKLVEVKEVGKTNKKLAEEKAIGLNENLEEKRAAQMENSFITNENTVDQAEGKLTIGKTTEAQVEGKLTIGVPKEKQAELVLSHKDAKLHFGPESGKLSESKAENETPEQPCLTSSLSSANEAREPLKPTSSEAGMLLADRKDLAQSVKVNEDEISDSWCKKSSYQSVAAPPEPLAGQTEHDMKSLVAGIPQNKLAEDAMVSHVEDKVTEKTNLLTVTAQADDKLTEKLTGPVECKTVEYEGSDMKGKLLDMQQQVHTPDEDKKEKSTDCDSALIPLHCVHG